LRKEKKMKVYAIGNEEDKNFPRSFFTNRDKAFREIKEVSEEGVPPSLEEFDDVTELLQEMDKKIIEYEYTIRSLAVAIIRGEELFGEIRIPPVLRDHPIIKKLMENY
jgi:hypothetical protein